MSHADEAVDEVREQTRALYKKVCENTAENHASIRGDLQDAGKQAQRLAAALRALARDRRVDEKQHLEHAVTLLEAASAGVLAVASADVADQRAANASLQEWVRDALQNISHAVAVQRAKVKQHA